MGILCTELSCGSCKCCGIIYDPFYSMMMMGSFCLGVSFMVYIEGALFSVLSGSIVYVYT
jgi:hypothetical protein